MPREKASEKIWFGDDEPPRSSAGGESRPSQPLPHDNRRRFPRFSVDGARIRLYREGFLASLGLARGNRGRAVLDLSEGGARVLLTEHLAPRTKVRLRIEMERYQDAIEVAGEVRWCVPRGRPSNFQAGIQFTEGDPALRRKIALMHEWFASPQYKALREKRIREQWFGPGSGSGR
jgi:hypothetical protein